MKTTGSLFFGIRVHRVQIARHVPLPQLVTLRGTSSDSLNGGTTQGVSTTYAADGPRIVVHPEFAEAMCGPHLLTNLFNPFLSVRHVAQK